MKANEITATLFRDEVLESWTIVETIAPCPMEIDYPPFIVSWIAVCRRREDARQLVRLRRKGAK